MLHSCLGVAPSRTATGRVACRDIRRGSVHGSGMMSRLAPASGMARTASCIPTCTPVQSVAQPTLENLACRDIRRGSVHGSGMMSRLAPANGIARTASCIPTCTLTQSVAQPMSEPDEPGIRLAPASRMACTASRIPTCAAVSQWLSLLQSPQVGQAFGLAPASGMARTASCIPTCAAVACSAQPAMG